MKTTKQSVPSKVLETGDEVQQDKSTLISLNFHRHTYITTIARDLDSSIVKVILSLIDETMQRPVEETIARLKQAQVEKRASEIKMQLLQLESEYKQLQAKIN